MQRFLCFVSSAAVACGAVGQNSGSSTGVPSHPILNIHLTDPNDAALLNDLADRQINSEQLLGALETRARAAETALGNQMSSVNAQMHELVHIGSSLAAGHVAGGVMQQLRGRSQERTSMGVSADMNAGGDAQTLGDQLTLVAREARASDKDAQLEAESAGDGFDASGPEAAARQKLMNAQKNFASVGNQLETEAQKTIDSKLALAMESPAHVGSPVPLPPPSDYVSPCQPDAHACPKGWRGAGGACVASSDYGGPCASELTLVGMSEEQLLAIAKYCRLDLPCQYP